MEILHQFLIKNLNNFLQKPLMIGFTKTFPEDLSKMIDKKTFTVEGVSYDVRLTRLTFGKKNEYDVLGITTDVLKLPRKGPLGGWGQHGYEEEAILMRKGILEMAMKHELMICMEICTWPFAKVVVQKPEEAHLRCFKEELNEKEENVGG